MDELTANPEAKSGPAPESLLYVPPSPLEPNSLYINVPSDFIDWRHANRQLMTVSAQGEIKFADDLTLDEAKYIIGEIIKWKMN